MRYHYEEEAGGELRMHNHLTGDPKEALLAAKEVTTLAKDVLPVDKFDEAEHLARMLIGTKKQRQTARHTLMTLLQPPPKRPIFYTQHELQFLPRHTRDIMRDLGDFVDMLVKAAVFEQSGKESIFKTSLGPAITQFKNYFSGQGKLVNRLTQYNQFLYRDAKHDFKLPKGRTEHRFTSREAVLTVFITLELATAICAISPMATRVRLDQPI